MNVEVNRLSMVGGRLVPHKNGAFVPIEEHEAAMELLRTELAMRARGECICVKCGLRQTSQQDRVMWDGNLPDPLF